MLQIQDPVELLNRLDRFSTSLINTRNPGEINKIVFETLNELFRSDGVEIYLYETGQNGWHLFLPQEPSGSSSQDSGLTAIEPNALKVFETGKVIYIPDTDKNEGEIPLSGEIKSRFGSRLFVPLMNDRIPVGVLGLFSSKKDGFPDETITVASFAGNIIGSHIASLTESVIPAVTTGDEVEVPLYTLDRISSLLGNHAELIDQTLAKFTECTPKYYQELKDAWNSKNYPEITAAAHKIKSSIDLIATDNLRTLIRQIHDISRRSDPDELQEMIRQCDLLIPQMVDQINMLLQNGKSYES